MSLLALAVLGRGAVDPRAPVLRADDEALLRGRAAFETLRVYGGRPFALPAHVERLRASAARIGLPEVGAEELSLLADEAVAAAATPEAVLRLVWTAGPEGEERPEVLALVSALPAGLQELRERGASLVSLSLGLDPASRSAAPWLLGGVKSTSYAVNMAAAAEARRRGADDAVFVGAGDVVLESPTANVWWRRGEVLQTPALGLGILAGVTRAVLLSTAPRLGYRVEEGTYRLAELEGVDELFTSSSVREVMPVVRLDGERVADGNPGRAARGLQQALRDRATSPY